MIVTPGTRIAWFRGPSGLLVQGVVFGESYGSPGMFGTRLDEREGNEWEQRIFECVEERVWGARRPTLHAGATWRVPECDLVELPQDHTWREVLRRIQKGAN